MNEVFLKLQLAFVGLHHRPQRVVGHRQHRGHHRPVSTLVPLVGGHHFRWRAPLSGAARLSAVYPARLERREAKLVPHVVAAGERVVVARESFWSAVYAPFMSRDMTRDDLRTLVRKGLEQTGGNYRVLTELFNMPASDYKRFLNFLRKHHCHVAFQQYRTIQGRPISMPAESVARKVGAR